MNIKCIFLVFPLLLWGHSAVAAATLTDRVTINYNGVVVLPPCTIDTNLVNIDFGDLPASNLAGTGSTSEWKQTTILLSDCADVTKYTVTATLDSSSANSQYIASTGTAKHVAIEGQVAVGANQPVALVDGYKYTQSLGGATTDSLLFKFRVRNDGTGTPTVGTVISTVTINYTFN